MRKEQISNFSVVHTSAQVAALTAMIIVLAKTIWKWCKALSLKPSNSVKFSVRNNENARAANFYTLLQWVSTKASMNSREATN